VLVSSWSGFVLHVNINIYLNGWIAGVLELILSHSPMASLGLYVLSVEPHDQSVIDYLFARSVNTHPVNCSSNCLDKLAIFCFVIT